MTNVRVNPKFDETFRKIGPDATAMFDNSASNPTEHASSEALDSVTARNVDDDLEELDDEIESREEVDEEDAEEDVLDEADENE